MWGYSQFNCSVGNKKILRISHTNKKNQNSWNATWTAIKSTCKECYYQKHCRRKFTKKTKKKSTNVASTKAHNLLGKAEKTTLKPKTPKKNVTGKCCECNTIWQSKEDEIFRKLNGRKKTKWIGCDKSQYRYCAHALCAGLVLIHGKPIKEHSFFAKTIK